MKTSIDVIIAVVIMSMLSISVAGESCYERIETAVENLAKGIAELKKENDALQKTVEQCKRDGCSNNSHSCDVNAVCNTTCSCKDGFSGDGRICIDMDECSTNSSSCDVNAVCNNTLGSYTCTCKSGYSGDGRTCTDIDECISGVHDCVNLTSCTNTAGSYTCGLSASECQNYRSLNSSTRKVTHGFGWQCDNNLGPGWFRFNGLAGSKMATSCPPTDKCGTFATGWMKRSHPSVADGEVSRTACFHSLNCCYLSTNIKVRNCSSYYVYYISGTPNNPCNFRYCGTD